MLKHLLSSAARRLAEDTRRLGLQFMPAERAAELTAGAVRTVTRNWPAATALAELASARFSASPASLEVLTRPRVLLATRFGAQTPMTELMGRELLAALGGREDIALTLCATRDLLRPEPDADLSDPAAARRSHDALLRLLRPHRVIDATEFAAADVASWVADHDVIVTCNDFSAPTSTPANIALAVMALGFARAMGRQAHAVGLLSGPDDPRMPRDAHAFLHRFARRATYASPLVEVASAWREAGFRVADGLVPCLAARPTAAEGALSRLVLAARSPVPLTGGTPTSGVTEWAALGRQLLLGGDAPAERPASRMPVIARRLIEGVPDDRVTRVQLGRGARWWGGGRADERRGDRVVADAAGVEALLASLAPGERVVTDCPELAVALALAGRDVVPPETVESVLDTVAPGGDVLARVAELPASRPALNPARAPIAAWLAAILPPPALPTLLALSTLEEGP
jgi:hypothetical protein